MNSEAIRLHNGQIAAGKLTSFIQDSDEDILLVMSRRLYLVPSALLEVLPGLMNKRIWLANIDGDIRAAEVR